MASREGFGSGFVLGSLVGGIVGGIVSAALIARRDEAAPVNEDDLFRAPAALDGDDDETGDRLAMDARRSLEEKISRINIAIEDVRQRLGGENGVPAEHASPEQQIR